MSKDLRERLTYTIFITIVIFMFTCVMYKLLLHYENWLEFSLMFSIAWGLGIFIRKKINDSSIEEILEIKAYIILSVIVLTTFICGVALDLPNWVNTSLHILLPFTVSLLYKS